MRNEYVLYDYYKNYLRTVRGLKESSINHYTGGLSTISKILAKSGKINDSIYEISDLNELQAIKNYLTCDQSFAEKDAVGHNMYSAALNNYCRFAEGEDFFSAKYDIKQMDIPVEIAERKFVYRQDYSRSSIIKIQSIKSAHYLCELNHSHRTFTAKSNFEQYMEGHHLIPLSNQREFLYSLDIYANVICLCPICHRLLHYGIEQEKQSFLEHLFDVRKQRLINSGINIGKKDFLELTM